MKLQASYTERRCVCSACNDIYHSRLDFDVSCGTLIFSNDVETNGLMVTSNNLLLCGVWSWC